MIEEQLFSGLANLGLGVLALAATGDDSASLESRRATIKDKYGLGAEEEELADAAEEP